MISQIPFHFGDADKNRISDADNFCFCPRHQFKFSARASHNSIQFKISNFKIKKKNRASITRSTVTKIRFFLLPRNAYEAARGLFHHKACQGTSHRDQELPGSHEIYA